jgi:hypothetical protein
MMMRFVTRYMQHCWQKIRNSNKEARQRSALVNMGAEE